MIQKTKEWFEALFPEAEISVATRGSAGLSVQISKMYEFVNLNFATLKKISERYGTDKIDVDDYAQSGCDSCDYGSSYTHTISIEDITKNLS